MMSRHSSTKLIVLIIFILTGYACNNETTKKVSTFAGEEKAVTMANKMFDAIGGTEAWCSLKSLYIKAEHTEPQMSIPYTSEIWRGIDRFELVIEQQNDSFHVKAVIDQSGGTVRYYDERDTSRTLSAEQLSDWSFDHNHNVYVLLHQLGCNPSEYTVRIDKDDRLTFYQDTVYLTSFGLDKQFRPYLFYRPNIDGTISGSIFSHWGTDGGLVHSAGGHPLDSNFVYRTEIWQPSEKALRETFGADIFQLQ